MRNVTWRSAETSGETTRGLRCWALLEGTIVAATRIAVSTRNGLRWLYIPRAVRASLSVFICVYLWLFSAVRRLVQKVGNVQHLDGGASFFQRSLNLKLATRIGGDDDLRAGAENVLKLAGLQTLGHGRLGQVIGACTATTEIGLREFDKGTACHRFHQLPRLLGDPLRVSEMTSIMVRYFHPWPK